MPAILVSMVESDCFAVSARVSRPCLMDAVVAVDENKEVSKPETESLIVFTSDVSASKFAELALVLVLNSETTRSVDEARDLALDVERQYKIMVVSKKTRQFSD